MPDQAKMITIQEARRSQSGKSLGVNDRVDGRWYNTKCWDLEHMVGQTIYAQTSESEWQGKPQYWINDYSMPDGQVQVAQTAPPQSQPSAGSHPQANPAPAPMAPYQPGPKAYAPDPPAISRDASIVSQTLCKSITFTSPDAAFAAYIGLYELVREWQATGRTPQAEAADPQQMPHDDIPF